jgi:hypothetical protein
MEVITIEKEAYYKLLKEFAVMVKKAAEHIKKESEWIGEIEAKKILGIKSRSKMQQLRDKVLVEFSQYGKIIRYSRSSILRFIEKHRVRMNGEI